MGASVVVVVGASVVGGGGAVVVVGGNAFARELPYRPAELGLAQPIFVLAVLGLRP